MSFAIRAELVQRVSGMQANNLMLFPVHYSNRVIPFSLFIVLFITVILVTLVIDSFYNSSRSSRFSRYLGLFFDVIRSPFIVLLLCFACYAACDLTQLYFPHTFNYQRRFSISYYLSLTTMLVMVWILIRALIISMKEATRREVDDK